MDISVGGPIDGDCLDPDANAPGQSEKIEEILAERLRDLAANQTRQVNSAIAALQKATRTASVIRKQIVEESESNLLDLAMDIARTILVQEIKAGRHDIDPIVKQAISTFPTHQDIVVYLNPDDLAQCSIAQVSEDSPDETGLKFAVDVKLDAGECRVETAEATVDARIEAKMQQVKQKMAEKQEAR